MKINGTIINYYFHCKRQCYLFANRLNLEDNSELVKIGKAIHEQKSSNSDNSEISIENIKVDKITKEYLTEIKKSDSDINASKWQLLFYLKVLKSKGIIRKGKLECVEKKKSDNKVYYFELTDEIEKELEFHILDIKKLINSESIPTVLNKPKCKNVLIMNIVIFKRGCKIWVVRDILLLWVNLVERIIHYVLEKMEKMYIFQLKILKKYIA